MSTMDPSQSKSLTIWIGSKSKGIILTLPGFCPQEENAYLYA